jgi:ERCC4-related helicase
VGEGGAQVAQDLTGLSQMTTAEMSAAMSKFRNGEARVLVSTTATEEGIDVPACDFVVRFSQVGAASKNKSATACQ